MKFSKITNILVITSALILSLKSFAVEHEFAGIGAMLKKDGNKTFVIKVLPDSPAEKALLQDCTQVLEINGLKTKKMTLEEIVSQIRGKIGTEVNLLIKEGKTKKVISIERNKITLPKNKDDKFMLHWLQVAPEGYISQGYFHNSKLYSVDLQNYIDARNYWEKRKDVFKKGYDACISYPKADQSACLINLVNRETQKTEFDQQTELQEMAIQQQATQNFINSMNRIQTNTNLNNINNTLMQQNMQIHNTNMQLRNTNMHLYNINNSLNRW